MMAGVIENSPVLRLSGLTRNFGGISVLSGLDLEVMENEILGILGPNGAGKSTLFNLIAGVLEVSAGTIEYRDRDVTQMRPWDRCRTGIARTYQIPQPFNHMTVFENVLVAAVHGKGEGLGQARRSAGRILEQTGLTALVETQAGALRLLDLKRLELARALACDPDLLLLDEIAGGLTEDECDTLVDLILGIRDEGKTIIWVEHVMAALRRACSRLAVIYGGVILASGTPQVVLADPEVRSIYLGDSDGL